MNITTKLMNKIQTKRQVRIVIGAAIILTGIVLWYFFFFTKTPVYALNEAREAVEAHDTTKFTRYVDMDSVLGSAYDDLIDVTVMNNAKLRDTQLQGVARQFVELLKQPTVSLVKGAMLDEISGKPKEKKDNDQQDVTSFAKNINAEKVDQDTGWKTIRFKGIEYHNVDGDTAIIGIKIAQEGIDDMVLDLRMDKVDGDWRATGIVNLKEYIQRLVDAHNRAEAGK